MEENSAAQVKIANDAFGAAALVKSTADSVATALNIQHIQQDILEIKTTLKEQSGVFVTKQEHQEVIDIQKDHEARLRLIESNMWKLIGMSSVISASLGIAAAYIGHFIK